MTAGLLDRYYTAFNAGDTAAMLDLLAEDIRHEPSQGEVREGKAAFRAFLDHMAQCYKERVVDPVYLVNSAGDRAAAEFRLEGRYLQTDPGFPEAANQRYRLRVGAFFEIRDGQISRVSTHYNLSDWIRQVS